MRRLIPLLAAGATLAGCATAAPPPPAPVAPLPVAAVAVPPVAPPPPPPLSALVGADGPAVQARLGEPSLTRAEGQGALWTYRREGCAVLVFFRQQGGVYRVTGMEAGASRLGAPAPDVETCAGRSPAP